VYGPPWTGCVPLRELLIVALQFGFDGQERRGAGNGGTARRTAEGSPVPGRNGAPVARGSPRGPKEGKRRSVKLKAAAARREVADSEERAAGLGAGGDERGEGEECR